jgi:TPR repeat protein
VDAQGNVYVGDDKNKNIRKITPDGTVTTVGDEADIKFIEPRSLAADQAGNVYVLDGAALKRIAPDGSVFMMAPDMTFDAAADGWNRALFPNAGGIAIDGDGGLLLTLREDHEIIRIAASGETTTIARNNDEFWLGRPNAVAIGANGNIYLADEHNKVVHQVTPAGNIGPLPGMHIPKPEPIAAKAVSNALSPEEAKALLAVTKQNAKKDPQAMFELANMYAERNDQYRALSSYKKAAKKGHAGAQYEHALRHVNGQVSYGLSVTNGDVAAGMAKQLAKRQVNAAKLFRQSADQGYALGQYALGKAYLNGEGVEQSTDTAIEWLSKAGSQGLFEAQLDLGEIYRKGNATPVDLVKAVEWYARAAEQGDTYSTAIKNALLVQTDPNGSGQQISADARAQTDLAFSYYTGSGVEQDLARAAELFQDSALLGNTMAQWMLGLMHLNGEGLVRDPEQSIEWLTIASELNHPDAQFYLGLMYDRGYGTDANKDLAYHWYSRSAEQGQLNAQFSLGILYYDGRSTKVGTKEARKWLETAAEQGDAHAQYMMAGLYLDDTSDESQSARAIELFEKAAAQGHVYAVGRLPGITATANGAAQ